VIGVNPIRTGYNAVADEWVGITPGTDGLFILSLIHELLKAGRIDLHYLSQYTNAPVLLDAETGLLMRDENGKELVIDRSTKKTCPLRSKRRKTRFERQPPYWRHNAAYGFSRNDRTLS